MSDPKYILILRGGDECYCYGSLNDALWDAKEHVFQYVTDHLRHDLPLKATDPRWKGEEVTVAEYFDIECYAVSSEKQEPVELPYQDWLDDYYQMQRETRREDEADSKRKAVNKLVADYLDAAFDGTSLPDSWDGIRSQALKLWEEKRYLEAQG